MSLGGSVYQFISVLAVSLLAVLEVFSKILLLPIGQWVRWWWRKDVWQRGRRRREGVLLAARTPLLSNWAFLQGMSVCLDVCLTIWLSLYLSASLFVFPPLRLFIRLFLGLVCGWLTQPSSDCLPALASLSSPPCPRLPALASLPSPPCPCLTSPPPQRASCPGCVS